MDKVRYMMMFPGKGEPPTLADKIRSKVLHYGDPPNTGCCAAGASMNCVDIKVQEYWKREAFEWVRDKSLEIALGK